MIGHEHNTFYVDGTFPALNALNTYQFATPLGTRLSKLLSLCGTALFAESLSSLAHNHRPSERVQLVLKFSRAYIIANTFCYGHTTVEYY